MGHDLTDDQVREIQWASSEEGKAQLRAAWEAAVQLRLDSFGLTMADVGALLWAAHKAHAPEDHRPAPPEHPRRVKMRELIAKAGPDGTTLRDVDAQMRRMEMPVTKQTLRHWAIADADAGLLEMFDGKAKGMWRAVQP